MTEEQKEAPSPIVAALAAIRSVLDGIAAEQMWEDLRASLPEKADPLDFNEFLIRNGRVPLPGDDVPPWRYRGWLRHGVQLLHAFGGQRTRGFPDRWGYYMRTLEAGKLLDEPIPRVEFEHADPAVLRETEKWVSFIEAKGASWWSALSDLVAFLAYGLAVADEPPRLDDKVCEVLYGEVKLQRWLEHPSDYLGALASERHGGGALAYFPTPHGVCECMTQVVCHDLKAGGADPRTLLFMEPACGAGRFVLHASNHTMRTYAVDLDPFMVLATKVNLAVYAPWGLYGLPFLGVAARGVAAGNSLRVDAAPAGGQKKRGRTPKKNRNDTDAAPSESNKSR